MAGAIKFRIPTADLREYASAGFDYTDPVS
jgi:hypothetical protein